jgi:hypothetical protein
MSEESKELKNLKNELEKDSSMFEYYAIKELMKSENIDVFKSFCSDIFEWRVVNKYSEERVIKNIKSTYKEYFKDREFNGVKALDSEIWNKILRRYDRVRQSYYRGGNLRLDKFNKTHDMLNTMYNRILKEGTIEQMMLFLDKYGDELFGGSVGKGAVERKEVVNKNENTTITYEVSTDKDSLNESNVIANKEVRESLKMLENSFDNTSEDLMCGDVKAMTGADDIE